MEDNHKINGTTSDESPGVNTETNHSHEGTQSGNVSSGGGLTATQTETRIKRKRGRPRKHDHTPMESPPQALLSSSFSLNSPTKRRGRPKGSGKLQALAALGGYFAETAGGNFSPYVLTVNKGEDIAGKVISVLQRPPRAALCILSAAGMVSRGAIRQPGSPNSILAFEGCFEILSLSGSFTYGEAGDNFRVMGMLSVSLAKPDGRVFGGVVGGSLIADGPIQLIVATFKQNIVKELKRRCSSDSSTAASRLEDSKMPRVPITRMADDNENCTEPTTAPLKLLHEGVDTIIDEDQNSNPTSPHNVDGNALQVLQLKLDKEASPDSVIVENQTSSPACSHSIDENLLQTSQHVSDQETSLEMTIAENQTSNPTARPINENVLQVLRPISDKGTSPNSFTIENKVSSPASLHNIDENALQVLQLISDQETSPNTTISENQNLTPTFPHNISENPLHVLQLSSEKVTTDSVIAANQISSSACPQSVSENA